MYVGGWGLTDGCLTELLLSHLVGNVGPHQQAHGDAKVLPNHFRDELQPLGALVYPLGTGWSSGQVPFTSAEGFPPRNPAPSEFSVRQVSLPKGPPLVQRSQSLL